MNDLDRKSTEQQGNALAAAPCSALNPGIVKTVEWLQSKGFRTTDSGDGKTRDFACDQPTPYVHMLSEPSKMVSEADRLIQELHRIGIEIEPLPEDGGPSIEAVYMPATQYAVITLWDLILSEPNVKLSHPERAN